MPLYEYECKQCGRHTEKIQKFSDLEITDFPHCGGTLERVPSAPAASFKGGGWYADGYGNAKPSSANDSKSDSAKSNGASSDSGAPKSESAAASSSTPTAGAAPAASPLSSSSQSSLTWTARSDSSTSSSEQPSAPSRRGHSASM
jgi:putative FmdB family regulatory protein